jgi:hypothetical protein
MEQEKKSERRERPNLSDSQDLVSHTYDMFLTSQTRIFTLSRYIYDGPASEIDIRLRTLFMEDILSFSISARRLIAPKPALWCQRIISVRRHWRGRDRQIIH